MLKPNGQSVSTLLLLVRSWSEIKPIVECTVSISVEPAIHYVTVS